MDCLVLIPDRDSVLFDAKKKNKRIPIYSALFQSLLGIEASQLIHDTLFLFICVYYTYSKSSQPSLQEQLRLEEEYLDWLVRCRIRIAIVIHKTQNDTS